MLDRPENATMFFIIEEAKTDCLRCFTRKCKNFDFMFSSCHVRIFRVNWPND